MYSDNWRRNETLRATNPVAIDAQTNYKYWVDRRGKTVGVQINFELADDVHYEMEAEQWYAFVEKVLHISTMERFVNRLLGIDTEEKICRKLKALLEPLCWFGLEVKLRRNDIRFSKIAFY